MNNDKIQAELIERGLDDIMNPSDIQSIIESPLYAESDIESAIECILYEVEEGEESLPDYDNMFNSHYCE